MKKDFPGAVQMMAELCSTYFSTPCPIFVPAGSERRETLSLDDSQVSRSAQIRVVTPGAYANRGIRVLPHSVKGGVGRLNGGVYPP